MSLLYQEFEYKIHINSKTNVNASTDNHSTMNANADANITIDIKRILTNNVGLVNATTSLHTKTKTVRYRNHFANFGISIIQIHLFMQILLSIHKNTSRISTVTRAFI